MKKLLLLTIFSSAMFSLHAQIQQQPLVYNNIPHVWKVPGSNALRNKMKLELLLKKTVLLNNIGNTPLVNNIDNMPIVAGESLIFTYLGNNNKGLDIYQSSSDNMYVIKPDSTFYSGMPTGSFKTVAPQIKVRP
ncbi:MAG: hypothetical protein ABI921_13765 [Panacibacter sp.]